MFALAPTDRPLVPVTASLVLADYADVAGSDCLFVHRTIPPRLLAVPRLGVPRLLQWPVVDDRNAFMIEDLECFW